MASTAADEVELEIYGKRSVRNSERMEPTEGPGDDGGANVAEEDDEDPTKYEDEETLRTIAYIKKTFKKRVCTSFVPDPQISDPDVCHCGKKRNEHPPDVDDKQTTWSVETSTRTEETDAFGVVEFPAYGQKTSKYIRVACNPDEKEVSKTEVNELWTLMHDSWKMEKPHLLISVTGGAQKLSTETSLKTALKEVFRKGLIDAAQSTGAWIITGGTNTGVMKLVGDAIRAHTLKQGSRKQMVAIGIATWGCITNKEALIVEQKKEKRKSSAAHQALYEAEEPKKGVKEAPLDPNHTHFILADDGRQHHYGAEIKLRAALEKKISNTEACGVKIPIVCIVIEGGPNTVKTVREAIEANTPVIIVDGSGRAADLLADAHKRFTEPKADEQEQKSVQEANDSLWKDLEPKIEKAFGKKEVNKVLSNIKSCLDHYNMITVFSLEGKGSAGSIDYAIIMTLLRVKEGETSLVDKMKLALAWDRIDVVKEHIYTDEATLTAKDLKELAFTAIVNNRVEFVKFFLERSLRLSELLESPKHEIKTFYDEGMRKNKHLRNALKDVKNLDKNLEELNGFIKKLVDQLFAPTKYDARGQNLSPIGKTEKFLTLITKPATVDAAMDLFFWSILSRLKSMAIVFLYEAKETFALSLIGHLMLKNLLKREKDSESKQELQRQVDFFEGLTTGLLTECYSSDQEMTIDLLVRPIPTFARLTPLEIAAQANNQSVLAHQACQNLLTVIWMGRISDENPFFLTILLRIPPLFFFAPLVLNFREETSTVKSETIKDGAAAQKDPESQTRKSSQDRRGSEATAISERNAQPKENPCSLYWKRLGYFLTAPCVKFTFNCVSYIVFLVLYSILLLTNFYPKISAAEIVLYVWIVTIFCEEIRQLVESRESGKRKFYNYLSSKWNWVDLIAVATFVLGLVLRLLPFSMCDKCFFAARIVFAFSLMTFYFRILHMFSIFKHLGPKLVMIGEMMIDLFYFMTILMVFVIAYGIAANVILYPNQELKPALIPDVLSGAWWSVYGEFNIEEVSGENCKASASERSLAEDCASMEYDDFNRTQCPGREENCPAIDYFGPIFLAFYALITNVMMINLLIAMFSNTFAKVEEIADVIWKIQRYHLVLDYESHPFLPPPLIVLDHAFRVIRAIYRKLRSSCRKKTDAGTDAGDAKTVANVKQTTKSRNRTFRMCFGDYYERDLIAWLKVNVEEYLLKKETEDAAADHLAKETNERIGQLYRKVEEMEQTRGLDVRLKSLEEKMNEIKALLEKR